MNGWMVGKNCEWLINLVSTQAKTGYVIYMFVSVQLAQYPQRSTDGAQFKLPLAGCKIENFCEKNYSNRSLRGFIFYLFKLTLHYGGKRVGDKIA